MNSDHKPKTRGQSDLVYWVYRSSIAVLSAERHRPWALVLSAVAVHYQFLPCDVSQADVSPSVGALK